MGHRATHLGEHDSIPKEWGGGSSPVKTEPHQIVLLLLLVVELLLLLLFLRVDVVVVFMVVLVVVLLFFLYGKALVQRRSVEMQYSLQGPAGHTALTLGPALASAVTISASTVPSEKAVSSTRQPWCRTPALHKKNVDHVTTLYKLWHCTPQTENNLSKGCACGVSSLFATREHSPSMNSVRSTSTVDTPRTAPEDLHGLLHAVRPAPPTKKFRPLPPPPPRPHLRLHLPTHTSSPTPAAARNPHDVAPWSCTGPSVKTVSVMRRSRRTAPALDECNC